jgi:hypothetical protein
MMSVIAECRRDKLLRTGKVTFQELAERKYDEHNISFLHTGELQKTEMRMELLKELNINHPNDTESLVTNAQLETIFDNFKDRYPEILRAMGERDRRKDKSVVGIKAFTGLVISSMSQSFCKFKVVKTKRIRCKGIRKTCSIYGLEFANQYVKLLTEITTGMGIDLNKLPMRLYSILGIRKMPDDEKAPRSYKRLLRA